MGNIQIGLNSEFSRSSDKPFEWAVAKAAERGLCYGATTEAEVQLAEALVRDPYDGGAALRLLGIRLDRGDADLDRALAHARQTVRFGGGPAAYAQLAKVFELRGEHELARKAAAQVEKPAVPAGSETEG